MKRLLNEVTRIGQSLHMEKVTNGKKYLRTVADQRYQLCQIKMRSSELVSTVRAQELRSEIFYKLRTNSDVLKLFMAFTAKSKDVQILAHT